MRTPRPRRPPRDGGGTFTQYLALAVVAVLMLGGLVAGGIPERTAGAVGDTVCRIARPGCDGESTGATARGGTAPGAGDARGDGGRTREKGGRDHDHGGPGVGTRIWDAVTEYYGGVYSQVADEGRDLWHTIAHPLDTAEQLAGGIWGHDKDVMHRAMARWNRGEYAASAGGVLWDLVSTPYVMIYHSVVTPSVQDDWDHGHRFHAAGRAAVNIAGWFIPGGEAKGVGAGVKAARGARAAKAARGVDDADKAVRARRGAKGAARALDDARHTRRPGDHGPAFTERQARDLLNRFARLSPAERTAFVASLTPREFRDLLRRASGDTRADLVAAAPPDRLGDIPDPPFRNAGGWTTFRGPLFRTGGPAARDIVQGPLGDCWCLAAAGAVAEENPALISRMFRRNPNGTYTVTFGDGHRETVTPDLPVRGAKPGGAGWPALLEKAMAQRTGGYAHLDGGDPRDMLRVLTGRAGTTRRADAVTVKDIGRGLDRHEAYVVYTPKDVRIPNAAARGVLPGHAYTVVAVDRRAGTVTLANPLGPGHPRVVLTQEELRRSRTLVISAPTR